MENLKASKFFIIALVMAISLVVLACTPGTVNTSPLAATPNPPATTVPYPGTTMEELPPVPAEYQPLYSELSAELAHFEGVLNQRWNHSQGQTIMATELAFANGNIGEGILNSNSLENNRLLLDRLQAMGVKGVVVAIKYPLLKPDFPRSSEYLQFYKDIVAECHRRGITVLVECGAIFAGTPYSPVQVDWFRYTTATFLQDLQDQLVLIASQIRPDYLTLANEPQTEESLTGLIITPTVWRDFIASTMGKIDRSGGLLLGAGTGTWENPAYINAIIGMHGLDYIDLHIYPLNKDGTLVERALDYALQARAAGQRVTVSESWLWKASAQELGNGLGDPEKIMNRDVYSFWYPVDARFIQDIMDLADATTMDFVSFFWTRNFFAYLDYSKTLHFLSTAQYNRLINQAFISNVQNDTLSSLGRYLQQKLTSRTAP